MTPFFYRGLPNVRSQEKATFPGEAWVTERRLSRGSSLGWTAWVTERLRRNELGHARALLNIWGGAMARNNAWEDLIHRNKRR